MEGRYICPHCGSTYVVIVDRTIKCTQCRKTVDQEGKETSINSGQWARREKKVIEPQYTGEIDLEKDVVKPETRLRVAPETKEDDSV